MDTVAAQEEEVVLPQRNYTAVGSETGAGPSNQGEDYPRLWGTKK